MFIFVRFALLSSLHSATKQFTVNCQPTRIDYPASGDVVNSMRNIMIRLESLETVQRSMIDAIASSLTSLLIKHEQQIAQTLKDIRREIAENLTSEHEIIMRQMNISNQHLIQEQSQIMLFRLSRHLDEQFQSIQKSQFNGSQEQLRRLRDELNDGCRNQTLNIETLHRQMLHNQSQDINEGMSKLTESQSQLQTLGNSLIRQVTEIKRENQQLIGRLSMDFNTSIWALKSDVRYLAAISGHQQFISG